MALLQVRFLYVCARACVLVWVPRGDFCKVEMTGTRNLACCNCPAASTCNCTLTAQHSTAHYTALALALVVVLHWQTNC